MQNTIIGRLLTDESNMHMQYQLKTPALAVFEYLSDMDKFVAIHPLIQRMEKVGPNAYVVHERIYLGFLPYPFTYPATVESDRASLKVIMCATVMRLTKIRMEFAICPSGEQCSVSEKVTFATWLPIRFILTRLFQSQHKQLFANLDAIVQ